MLTLIVCDECENGIHENCIAFTQNQNDPNHFFDKRACICENEVCNKQ
jgi:hypothetical protein